MSRIISDLPDLIRRLTSRFNLQQPLTTSRVSFDDTIIPVTNVDILLLAAVRGESDVDLNAGAGIIYTVPDGYNFYLAYLFREGTTGSGRLAAYIGGDSTKRVYFTAQGTAEIIYHPNFLVPFYAKDQMVASSTGNGADTAIQVDYYGFLEKVY